MDNADFFTLFGFEAHRNLMRALEEPADLAYLRRLPPYRLVKLIFRYRINCIFVPILCLIYFLTAYRQTASWRNHRRMIRLADTKQGVPNCEILVFGVQFQIWQNL